MLDDDNFIDDTGVDPADRYGSDHGGYSPSRAPQVRSAVIYMKLVMFAILTINIDLFHC